jgi:hypothetical protein
VFPLNEIVLILWRLLAEKTGEWHGMSGMSFWCGVLYTVQ